MNRFAMQARHLRGLGDSAPPSSAYLQAQIAGLQVQIQTQQAMVDAGQPGAQEVLQILLQQLGQVQSLLPDAIAMEASGYTLNSGATAAPGASPRPVIRAAPVKLSAGKVAAGFLVLTGLVLAARRFLGKKT